MDLKALKGQLKQTLRQCQLCPHRCKVDRLNGQTGFCGASYLPTISAAMPHHGEEPPLSGTRGSGTIFFSFCNMACIYCQNYQISQEHQGRQISIVQLAEIMLNLEEKGCHNINLVSPTIWIPQIVEALSLARDKGLSLPLVYNTGGYENPEIIEMLEGVIDIYMPDMRYGLDHNALRYSKIKNYVKYNRQSILAMYKQVKELVLDKQGIATRGLLIRLLVLPHNIGGLKETLDFIKDNLSVKVSLSLMAQYHPTYKAKGYPHINRPVTGQEYREVVQYAHKLGFESGYIQQHQDFDQNDPFIPDFNHKDVFGPGNKS